MTPGNMVLNLSGDDNWAAKTYDDLIESANEIGPNVTDMLWTAAKKQALRDREVVSVKLRLKSSRAINIDVANATNFTFISQCSAFYWH